MGNIVAIIGKELRQYFTTPVAYVALTVFTIISSVFFLLLLSDFQQYIVRGSQLRPEMLQYLNLVDYVFAPLFYNVAVVFIFVVPLITMRLIAEERRLHTFELLMTNPVTPFQIALGKYLSSLVVVLTMVGLLLVFPVLMAAYTQVGAVAWGTVLTGLLGLFLAGAAFSAVGLFFSSLTNSQVVAGAITFCSLLLLWMIGRTGSDSPGVTREVLTSMSAIEHIRGFAKGVIDLKDLVYYLSVIGLGLFMTQRSLETQRWR